ncbi:MAG TPA: polymer-forming cytoskeletal protein [Gemmatimonadales bacterium]|nr:polymer-forming cytoskeletal protein [Gemmatimonadales bacterium]
MLFRKPAVLLAVTALGAATVALRAEEPVVGSSTGWRSRLELVSQFLSETPSHVVRDHSVTIATGMESLTFDYADGGSLVLSLDGGDIRVDGRLVGHAPAGGAFEAAWRALVVEASRKGTPAALDLVREWHPQGLSHEEAAYAELFRQRASPLSAPPDAGIQSQRIAPSPPGGLTIDLSDLSDPVRLSPMLHAAAELRGDALRITVPGGQAREGHFSIGTDEEFPGPLLVVRGDADIYGTLDGNLATVEGNILVHPGGVVTGDVLAVRGQVRDLGGEIRGQIRTVDSARPSADRLPAPPESPPAWLVASRNAAGVAGVFFTLVLVGFGLVLFARPPLEVISDTALHSFSRSLLVGLLGEVLILPTFGMLIVGLVLSVAGILLVPFAVIVFALLLIVAVLGGFLAVAHAMGESLTRRQLARGVALGSANSYRYVLVGLAGVAALWLCWVLFGWVPVAGTLVLATAVLVTWLLATVGFGASLLSRAGFREHFAGRLLPAEALTDEYLWATPQFGVTAVQRPPSERSRQ